MYYIYIYICIDCDVVCDTRNDDVRIFKMSNSHRNKNDPKIFHLSHCLDGTIDVWCTC